jgi:hypothetical protein
MLIIDVYCAWASSSFYYGNVGIGGGAARAASSVRGIGDARFLLPLPSADLHLFYLFM